MSNNIRSLLEESDPDTPLDELGSAAREIRGDREARRGEPAKARREERLELQEKDDGDPSDTVWRGISVGTVYVYHEEKECADKRTKKRITDVVRWRAQAECLSPCPECVIEVDGGRYG